MCSNNNNISSCNNARERYKQYLSILKSSELTIVHREPGEDHCCEDVKETEVLKKQLAVKLAIASVEKELDSISILAMVFSRRKIELLIEERTCLLNHSECW